MAHKAALIEWSSFKYIAFDAPSRISNSSASHIVFLYNLCNLLTLKDEGTYEERYEFLQQFLVAIPRVIVPLYYKYEFYVTNNDQY